LKSHALTSGKVAVAVLPVLAALLLGQWATFPNLQDWYAGLLKPAFNPPNWLFGPVWTALYALMALCCWRLLRHDSTPARNAALCLFFAQLALNAAWSWLFFAAHSPLLGLLDIVPQWLLIVAAIVVIAKVDRLAALCLVPLAVWVGFATVLNYEIYRLNP
jgi:translocator protein